VAIEPHAPPASLPETPAPAIENEIPSYRAIHPLAVVSPILGALSLLSFIHLAFVVAGVAAILTGARASRTIRRMPEVLTGRGPAQAGIALGLVFSLSAITIGQVQALLLTREVRRFAETYRQVLESGDRDLTFYWTLFPAGRAGKAPREAIPLIKEGMGSHAHEFEERYGAFEKVLSRLNAPGGTIRVDAIEGQGVDGVTPYAAVRLRLTGGAGSGGAPAEEFALLLLRAHRVHRRDRWFVEDLRYPYQPSSYAPAPKPVDDGHDHAH
jgi:hypothetical protein